MPKPDYTSLDLPEPPGDRPYVLLNMVMSIDGKVVIEETEQGIGSAVDQRLMRELRVNADIILNGASTLRKSGSSPRLGGIQELEQIRAERGLTRFPVVATLSASGNLPLERIFFTAGDFQAVIYLSEVAPEVRRRAIEATGRSVVTVPRGGEVPSMLRHMRNELGAKVLLLEGGPTLNAQFFRENAVDEVFLTVGPVIVGGSDTITPVEGTPYLRATAPRLDLISAVPLEESGEVFLRYRVRH
ncbi:MAG: dihydrofolate reductase family protein [Dehalococcoidia bacterium]|nr:dihydrofolate reductase family protein [Dehalococcoidia bacterium]MCB9486009.1 dihydrofolate reductase family protein [Thermoflexaceae bacterium]